MINPQPTAPNTGPKPVLPPLEPSENTTIAARFLDYADLLERQGDDRFRIRAYREAGEDIAKMQAPLRQIWQEGGLAALIALPKIGQGIAAAIVQMLTTGRWAPLDRLHGDLSPERVFCSVPGIGPRLAARLADRHHLETLEQLETLLHDDAVHVVGIGVRRRAAIIAALSGRLGRSVRGSYQIPPNQMPLDEEPPITLILQADAQYTHAAAAKTLPMIAPLRFNPTAAPWLPVLHCVIDGWNFTALYSNSAVAHRLLRTDDWVVVYFQKNSGPEGRRTVVTETRGPLRGRRVVRGREAECIRYFADLPQTGTTRH